MNYSLHHLPNCNNRKVYFDISIDGLLCGRLVIKLFRDVFAAGVENFFHLAVGDTQCIADNDYCKHSPNYPIRSYLHCKAFRFLHNSYLMFGDIYQNNGKTAGTIYEDQPIPPIFGDYYLPHNTKGLISLVPFMDDHQCYYDSTFMITLADSKLTNSRLELDKNQVVIGQVCYGLEVLDKINKLITPHAGRKYPQITISRSGAYR